MHQIYKEIEYLEQKIAQLLLFVLLDFNISVLKDAFTHKLTLN